MKKLKIARYKPPTKQQLLDAAHEHERQLSDDNNELRAHISKLRTEAAARPFRQISVILTDASGKLISQSMLHLNNGDEAEASIDEKGDIRIITVNSAR